MVEVHWNKKKYRLPESYNELTGYQLLQLVPLLSESDEDPDLIYLRILRVLLDMNKFKFAGLSIELKYHLKEHATWVLKPSTLTEQLIPKHRHNFHTYYGPKSAFDNLIVEEFHACEIYYNKAKFENSKHALASLVAILYRPAKPGYDFKRDPDGDCRVTFNPNELEYWTEITIQWPLVLQQAILLWYDGCKELLIRMYPQVFERQEGSISTPNDDHGAFNLISSLSDSGKFGDFWKASRVNIHLAMKELQNMIIHMKELEAKSKEP